MISHAKISRHQSTASQLPSHHTGVSPAHSRAALCRVVLLHAPFYMMSWFLGYSVMGMLSFPREGEIARAIYKAFSP